MACPSEESIWALLSSEAHTTLPQIGKWLRAVKFLEQFEMKWLSRTPLHSPHIEAPVLSLISFCLWCSMILLNLYHKRSPWCASLNHLLCDQKLPCIIPSFLTPTTASWAEWNCFDSWENWGSERLNNLPTITLRGSGRVGFKLSLISLQSLLHEKWPSSCFYALLLWSKHFWVPIYMSNTVTNTRTCPKGERFILCPQQSPKKKDRG